MEPIKKNILRLSSLALMTMIVASPLVLMGCNTIEGAGEDVEAAGDGIADTARDAKD